MIVKDKDLGMEKNAFVRYDKWEFSDYESKKGIPIIGTGIKITLENVSKWVDSGMGGLLGIISDQTVQVETCGEIKYRGIQHRIWDADRNRTVEEKEIIQHYVNGGWEERLRNLWLKL